MPPASTKVTAGQATMAWTVDGGPISGGRDDR